MSSRPAGVERLERAAEVLERADPDSAKVAAGMRLYLTDPAANPLEVVLGLPSRWWREPRNAARDRAIRDLAALFEGSTNSKAGQVQREIRNYRASCWPRDRHRGEPYPATPVRLALFAIFSIDPDPPSGLRQLNSIIGG